MKLAAPLSPHPLSRYAAYCDPRLRPLAYAIKRWARARRINCPGEGTLSSYGYLLLLIHFLQSRQPPVLPCLQLLDPPADSADALPPRPPRGSDAYKVSHPTREATVCDTYFFQPRTVSEAERLRAYAPPGSAPNTESLGELFAGFFRFYAWDFDHERHVVSARTGGRLERVVKAEDDGWPLHGRLAIEDPFETWSSYSDACALRSRGRTAEPPHPRPLSLPLRYDVAHVLKLRSWRWMLAEMARAWQLCAVAATSSGAAGVPPLASLLDAICADAPPPPFAKPAEDAADAAQKGATDDADHDEADLILSELLE